MAVLNLSGPMEIVVTVGVALVFLSFVGLIGFMVFLRYRDLQAAEGEREREEDGTGDEWV